MEIVFTTSVRAYKNVKDVRAWMEYGGGRKGVCV